jgi:tetratricopeptide (TPR) repeat protein
MPVIPEASLLNGPAFRLLRALAELARLLGWQRVSMFLLRRALVLRPFDAEAAARWAEGLFQTGQKGAAINALQQLLKDHPGRASSWFDLAYWLESAGRHGESEPAFRAALDLAPDMDRAWYGLALVHIREQRWGDASAALRHTTRLQPRSHLAWYQMGKVLMKMGHAEQALEVIRHLRALEPQVAARLADETGLGALV